MSKKRISLKSLFTFSLRYLVIAGLRIIVNTAYSQKISDRQIPSDFELFADTLSEALQNRDTTYLFNRVDQEIMNGLSYNKGKVRFKELWRNAQVSLGKELITALHLGGAKSKYDFKIFVPHYWVTFPDSLDAFRYVIPLSDTVHLFQQKNENSPIITMLVQKWTEVIERESNYVDGDKNLIKWIRLKTANDKIGYVQKNKVRSVIDYRFWFEKKNNKWMLMGWAAGD